MIVKILTEHYLEFLSLKGGCTGSFESILVKIPHCWKSHVTAQVLLSIIDRKHNIIQLKRYEPHFRGTASSTLSSNEKTSRKRKWSEEEDFKDKDDSSHTRRKHSSIYDFLVTVKAAPHECVIRTGQP